MRFIDDMAAVLEALGQVGEALGPLREEVVFVGGAVAPLLITDPAAQGIRPTQDVDLVVEAATYGRYADVEARLRERGFQHAPDDDVICRWRIGNTLVDVMPSDPTPLGFSNRWYPYALRSANPLRIRDGLEVRVIGAVAFVATKLEAFQSPTRKYALDFQASRDLEDVAVVLDGRTEFDSELEAAEPRCRRSYEAPSGLS